MSKLAEDWQFVISELKSLRSELAALQTENAALREKIESKYTVPDGYRVMLIHESE